LTPFRFSLREQLMVSWAGLRGAVPIVVATYPLIAGASEARTIFNLVFFVVFISVLLQGTSVPLVSRWLRVAGPLVKAFRYPIEYHPTGSTRNELVEMPVPDGSMVIGKALGALALPAGVLVVLIRRNDDVLVPRGTTQIESRDTLLVLAEREALDRVRGIVSALPRPSSPRR
jgi:cell volume regulation protein A